MAEEREGGEAHEQRAEEDAHQKDEARPEEGPQEVGLVAQVAEDVMEKLMKERRLLVERTFRTSIGVTSRDTSLNVA